MQRLVTRGEAVVVVELLPLAHHAVAVVVEDDDLDRQLVGRGGLEFTEIHAHAAVAVDVDHDAVRLRELRADGGWQAEAHRAHAARRQPQARLAIVEVLRGPHLVLADARRNDGFALGVPVDLLDHCVRLDQFAAAVVVQAMLLLEVRDLGVPGAEVRAESDAPAVIQHIRQVAVEQADLVPVDALDLADLGNIDVEVRYVLRVRREAAGVACHAVVETGAYGDEKIAVLDRVVGRGEAVHAEHVQGQRVLGVAGAECHQRGGDGDAVFRCEPPHGLGGVAVDHAAAGIDQRPFRLGQHGEEALAGSVGEAVVGDGLQPPSVAGQRQRAAAHEGSLPVLHVFRNIDDDGAGSAGAGEFEGAAHGGFEPLRVRHQEHVLGDRTHDRGYRGLLERVRADGAGRDLAADDDDGDGVGHAVAHRGHRVGRARAGRHHDDADLAAGAGVTGCHESGALFVRGHDQRHGRAAVVACVQLVVAEYRIVGGQDRAAAVAEDRIDAFVRQHLHHDIGAAHDFSCQGMTARALCAGLFAHLIAVAL